MGVGVGVGGGAQTRGAVSRRLEHTKQSRPHPQPQPQGRGGVEISNVLLGRAGAIQHKERYLKRDGRIVALRLCVRKSTGAAGPDPREK